MTKKKKAYKGLPYFVSNEVLKLQMSPAFVFSEIPLLFTALLREVEGKFYIRLRT